MSKSITYEGVVTIAEEAGGYAAPSIVLGTGTGYKDTTLSDRIVYELGVREGESAPMRITIELIEPEE